MKFDIYHSAKINFFEDILPKESYTKVASIETESLDEAYHQSQNISSSWLQNPTVITELTQCRSTSMGDIIYNIEEKQSYMVSGIGFKKVDMFN